MLPVDLINLVIKDKEHELGRLLTLEEKNVLLDLLNGGTGKTDAQIILELEKEKKMLLEELKYLELGDTKYSNINKNKIIQKLMDEIEDLKFTIYKIKKSFYEK